MHSIKKYLKSNYDFTQIRIYFNAWKEYVFAKNDFMLSVQNFDDKVLKRKLADFLLKWVGRVSRQKVEHELSDKADRFNEKNLAMTYFRKYYAAFRRTRINRKINDEKITLIRQESGKSN
jgi:hypothetical protein